MEACDEWTLRACILVGFHNHSFALCTEPDTEVSRKGPWAWMFQQRHHADESDHDATEEDDDHEHLDDDSHPWNPHQFWDGDGCPLGFKRDGGMGNWGFCCPLRNATCPMGFGRHHYPLGFGRRRSFCPMGFSGPMPFGFGNFCGPMGFGGFRGCPMGFGSTFTCPMKGYGMFGGRSCPLGFKPGSSGCPLRNHPCPMKAMRGCPMGFKHGGSGCPMRKYSCPMGFGKGKHCAKKEEPKASSGEVRSLLSSTSMFYFH